MKRNIDPAPPLADSRILDEVPFGTANYRFSICASEMAVFMINICKFNGCGITFPSLGDLIQHIEDTHIDYDPIVVEQKEASQPSCIPLSYVLRFFTEASRREYQSMPPLPVPDVRRRFVSAAPKTPSVRSSTPTGSELDEEDMMMSQSEDSNDSWTTVEEYSSEFILRYGVKQNGHPPSSVVSASQDKPFACPVPGCKKRYKNVNGIKYHSKNGHKKDGKIKKAYKCHCGKSYKTAQGLKNHTLQRHTATPASADAKPKQNLIVTASNSIHSRPLNFLDAVDGNKLVRIYDSLKAKDLPSLTIPKHNLKNVDPFTTSQFIRSTGLLTPNSTPGTSPVDRAKYDRSPKVMVQSQPLAPLTPNEQLFMPKLIN